MFATQAAAGIVRPPSGRFAIVTLAAFTVSLSANIVTPLLPFLLAKLVSTPAAVAQHTAWLNGAYLLAMFASAPALGSLSDRATRRSVLLGCMAIFTASLLMTAGASGIVGLYLSRLLSGVGAGAVLPVLLAHVSESYAKEERTGRFAYLVTAVMTGSLVGPYLGGLATLPGAWSWMGAARPENLIGAPIFAAALASDLAFAGVCVAFGAQAHRPASIASDTDPAGGDDRATLPLLYLLSIVLMYGVGAFEVGLATVSRISLQLDPVRLGMMYAECALVMLVMQALFLSKQFKDFADRHLVAPAIAMTAVALAFFPYASSHETLAFVVAAIAGGAGIVAPLISYRVSIAANAHHGRNFGLQSASSSLGQALGAAGGGFLAALGQQLPFLVAATVLVAGYLLILQRARLTHHAIFAVNQGPIP